jgi:hypothetical protein
MYMQVIPNSHSFGSLKNILNSHEYGHTEDLTEEYLLIGFKNTLERKSELEKIKEVNGEQGPCFRKISDIIEYIESGDWTLKDLIFRIENTLKNGYDLKSIYVMDRHEVISIINDERDYQNAMWGDTKSSGEPGRGERTIDEFALYITGLSNELLDLASHFGGKEEKLHIIRKIAALCVHCGEQHGLPDRT